MIAYIILALQASEYCLTVYLFLIYCVNKDNVALSIKED